MSGDGERFRVGAIQAAPVYFHLQASLEKAVRLIHQAAAQGAQLAAFGEAWLPGYPLHAFAAPGSDLYFEMARDYLVNGIDIPGRETEALCAAAREAQIDVVIGVSERDPATRGTLYSTLLFIGDDGQIVSRHRKLRPSPQERSVWGDGDAIDMSVHERGYASVSGLVGCEHQMALPTFALAEQGAELHIAAWAGAQPQDPRRASLWASQEVLARAFALQAGCYVLSVGAVLPAGLLPEKYAALAPEGFVGASLIVDPRGNVLSGPASGETILYVDCLRDAIRTAKIAFDCGGHSARRDQLKLSTPAIDAHEAGMDDDERQFAAEARNVGVAAPGDSNNAS